MPPADRAISRGLAYLEKTQLKDGGFQTFAGIGRQRFVMQRELHTVFGPALILGALHGVEGATEIKGRLAVWLRTQKNASWSFNYWAVDAPERHTRPYPNDLDDTFCALAGLYLHDRKIIDSACLASVVRLLLAAEEDIGGPYHTWLVDKQALSEWRDVDLAVNCNVAYFLQLVHSSLSNLTAMMERAIASKTFASSYYPSSYMIQYFMARAYHGPRLPDFARIIARKKRDDNWGTPLHTALAVSALYRSADIGVHTDAIAYLAGKQQADGSWPAEAVWLDEAHGQRKHHAGSPALTTAFVLEALAYYRQSISQPPTTKIKTDEAAETIHRRIFEQAQNMLQALPFPLRQRVLEMVRQIAKSSESQEITLLPYMFAQSLQRRARSSDDLFVGLGLANMFGWMAYTIYDDFLDNEGDPRLLSVANVAMRESLAHFRGALPGNEPFQSYVQQAFDRIDAANAREIEHCRFNVDSHGILIKKPPSYKSAVQLAERSVGHALTPVAVLAAQGVRLDDARLTLVHKGLRHYLAARQLNDDLHDWQQDFRKGHISFVVAHILRQANVPPGRQTFENLFPKMERQFWHASLQELCRQARRQIGLSRQAFRQSGLLKSDSPLQKLIDNLDSTLSRTLQEQADAEKFLAAYKTAKH